ncbi:hypothetical protein GCM10010433_28110 [Streptomyces pulveraceus]
MSRPVGGGRHGGPGPLPPDGTTPLWRAVGCGSPAIVSAVLGDEPRPRLAEASHERLLVLARSWYGTGAVEELRRGARARQRLRGAGRVGRPRSGDRPGPVPPGPDPDARVRAAVAVAAPRGHTPPSRTP